MKQALYRILGTLLAVVERISTKVKRSAKSEKLVVEKIVSSVLYKSICFVSTIITAVGFVYNIFFLRDFQARTILYTIFLFAIAWVLLSKILRVTFVEGKKLTKSLDVELWCFIFLSHFIGFVFR